MDNVREKLVEPMCLGNCEELDCEHFRWCGDSYEHRNTECICLLIRERVCRYEVEEKCVICPLGKVWEENDNGQCS